jgi:hypothetical protein
MWKDPLGLVREGLRLFRHGQRDDAPPAEASPRAATERGWQGVDGGAQDTRRQDIAAAPAPREAGADVPAAVSPPLPDGEMGSGMAEAAAEACPPPQASDGIPQGDGRPFLDDDPLLPVLAGMHAALNTGDPARVAAWFATLDDGIVDAFERLLRPRLRHRAEGAAPLPFGAAT